MAVIALPGSILTRAQSPSLLTSTGGLVAHVSPRFTVGAFVLLLLCTLSTPIIKNLYFLKIYVV